MRGVWCVASAKGGAVPVQGRRTAMIVVCKGRNRWGGEDHVELAWEAETREAACPVCTQLTVLSETVNHLRRAVEAHATTMAVTQ